MCPAPETSFARLRGHPRLGARMAGVSRSRGPEASNPGQEPGSSRLRRVGLSKYRARSRRDLASLPRTSLGQDLNATLFASSRTHTQDPVRGSHAGSFSARVRRPQPTAPAQNQLPGHVLQTIEPIGSGLRFTADQSEGKINLRGREERGGQLETRGGAMRRLPETPGIPGVSCGLAWGR